MQTYPKLTVHLLIAHPVALKHTKNNKRKGRKLAITGLTIAASIAAISLSYLLIGFIFNYII